jgi:hypothetical protein
MPPRAVFDSVFGEPEVIKLGSGLNQTYARTIKQALKARGRLTDEDFEQARIATERYLDQFPEEQQTGILRGAMVSAYMSETPESDAAIWLPGEKTDEGREPGIAHKSIEALREIGVLDEIAQTRDGLVAYPGASIQEPTYRTVGINGVWFNWYRAQCEAKCEPVPEKMGDVPKDKAKWAKQQVEKLAASEWRGLNLLVREEGERKVAYLTNGKILGVIARDSEKELRDEITLQFMLTHDGNLRSVVD